MCVKIKCIKCKHLKYKRCVLRCFPPAEMIVICISCADEWKWHNYMWNNHGYHGNLLTMIYDENGKLIENINNQQNVMKEELVIIDYFYDAFCHYIPVFVIAKEYFNNVVKKMTFNDLEHN